MLFENTRPYNDDEVPAAIERIVADPRFDNILAFFMPATEIENYKQLLKQIDNVHDFQKQVMDKAVHAIVNKTSCGLTFSGCEQLSDAHKCTFIGNHRDIVLDAAILQIILFQVGLETAEITFGSNLMCNQLIVDLGKINKMFRIVRGGNIHDFYKNSLEVSSYMRYAITQKKQSTWIAQRNGRTKDGNDKTEVALLKMLSISSQLSFLHNMEELNLTPIAISYEYEPCDFLKTQELYVSKYQQYLKSSGEDITSILTGIKQYKGHISLVISPSISKTELTLCDQYEKNEKYLQLSKIIDTRIYHNYKLWKTNYIAHDIVHESYKHQQHYSCEEKKAFVDYMDEGLHKIAGDYDELRAIFLSIYANPVENKKKLL